jgi:hypothetical protein
MLACGCGGFKNAGPNWQTELRQEIRLALRLTLLI